MNIGSLKLWSRNSLVKSSASLLWVSRNKHAAETERDSESVCGFTHRQTAPLHARVCVGVCVCAHNSKPIERSCHHDPNLTVSFSPPQHSSRLWGPRMPLLFFSLSPPAISDVYGLRVPCFTQGSHCNHARRSI